MPSVSYYNRRGPYHKVSRARFLAIQGLLPAQRPLRILDVGCGDGTLGKLLKKEEPGISVYGIDVSEAAIARARNVLDGVWIGDILTGTFPHEVGYEYDAIVASEVVEHLFEPEKLLTFLKPLLDIRIPLIITTPNILFWKNRLHMMAGKFEYSDDGLMDRGHVHFFSWAALKRFIVRNGFHITGTKPIIPTRLFKPIGGLLPGLCAYQFAIRIERT